MQLPDNLASFGEYLNKLPQAKLAQAISLILLLYIAYLLAQITWQVVPVKYVPSIPTASASNNTAKVANSAFDVESVIKLNIFGEYNAEQVQEALPEVQDAPETKLNLTLSGVVASSDPNIAAAVIENAGKQETYGIGDKIKGTRAQFKPSTCRSSDHQTIRPYGNLDVRWL